MNSVMVRQASDDFLAWKIADAMQSLEAVEVIAIVYQDRESLMHEQPRGVWHVFCKYDSNRIDTDEIDEVIDRLSGSATE